MSTVNDFLTTLQKMTEEKSVQPKTSNKTAVVNLPELGSAAVLFSPKKNQTKGKSTQQKKKVDPALQAFIDQAVTAKKAAVVRQDITIPAEKKDDTAQKLVYEAKPGDFISAESFRATKQKTGTLNVAAYIRVSTDSSDQENSYETQERYFNQLIEANPEWNPIGVYSDYGISGTSSEKRTGFRRLLRHCKAGKIDRVICKSISRFARNTADFMMALDLLRENNVTILFEKENLDTADPTSEFILTTLGAIAQEESRSISGNINLGNKMRFKRGDVRNVDIYGYRYSGETITSESGYKYKAVEIVEQEAVVVRRIFQEVADGFSFADIARKLNREHIPAPESSAQKLRKVKSKKGQLNSELDAGWTNGRISLMIRNERYAGDVLVQKSYTADYLSHEVRVNKGEVQQYYIKDHHPAIVSRELFEKVQKTIKANADAHKREDKTQWAFSGRLICGSCGRFFNVRNGNLNPIWFCPSAKQNNGKSICHAESVYEEQIVRVIRRAVIERFQLSSSPIRDDVSVADIMSGRYAENTDFLTDEADDFVIQMQARLENLQKIDFMERDRCFYKKQIIALQKDAEAAHIFAFKLGYLLNKAHSMIDFEDYRDLFNKYDTLTKISFDYAVVEKEPSIQVLRYSGDWKDVGTWNMMAEVMADKTKGKAILDETCENTNVVNELNIPILCMGCKDMIIAASGDGILISDKERSGYMKPYVEKIETEAKYAEKSWGTYTVIDVQPGSMTVKVSMRAGEHMTYHMHNYREEVWTVVSGKGKAIVDGMEQVLRTGDVITIAAGCKHTIEAITALDMIEVQLGEEISVSDKVKFPIE